MQPYLLTASSNMAEPSLVRAPGAPRATTAWALNKIEDRNGNAATVEYTRTEGDAAGLWWMQLRPSQISYAPNRSVRFIYDETRPDKIDGFAGGTHTRTDGADDPDRDAGRPGRRPRGAAAPIPNQISDKWHHRPKPARSVTECDGADARNRTAATRRVDRVCRELRSRSASASPGDRDARLTVVDINGDGRSDLIERSSRWRTDFDRADGIRRRVASGFAAARRTRFHLLRAVLGAAWDLRGAAFTRNVQTLDVDADGRTDALAQVGDRYQLFQPTQNPLGQPVRAGPRQARRARTPPVALSGVSGRSGRQRPAGLRRDRAPVADERWSYRLNTGAAGASRFAPKVETTIRRNGIGNFAVDTDGDGRTELIGRAASGVGLGELGPERGLWRGDQGPERGLWRQTRLVNLREGRRQPTSATSTATAWSTRCCPTDSTRTLPVSCGYSSTAATGSAPGSPRRARTATRLRTRFRRR